MVGWITVSFSGKTLYQGYTTFYPIKAESGVNLARFLGRGGVGTDILNIM
jgi:hypothetical protein